MINPKIIIGSGVLVAQLCLTLCDPWSVCGILQAGILKGVAIPFWFSWPRDQTWVSCIASRFFTIWATRAARPKKKKKKKIIIETMSKSPLSKCKWFNAQIATWAQMLIISTFYERCINMNSLNWLFVQVELNLLKSESVLQLESPAWLSKSEFWSIAKFPRNLSGAFSRWLVADVYSQNGINSQITSLTKSCNQVGVNILSFSIHTQFKIGREKKHLSAFKRQF